MIQSTWIRIESQGNLQFNQNRNAFPHLLKTGNRHFTKLLEKATVYQKYEKYLVSYSL